MINTSRKFDSNGNPICKYTNQVFLDEDDLAQCESAHGSDLKDFEIVDGSFRLIKVQQ